MKAMIFTVAAAMALTISTGNVFGAETKRACVEQKQKDGKVREVCKEIKVHKKLEGTPVPGQKK
jgi:hypothetical protein